MILRAESQETPCPSEVGDDGENQTGGVAARGRGLPLSTVRSNRPTVIAGFVGSQDAAGIPDGETQINAVPNSAA
jgi:hypothetical protein